MTALVSAAPLVATTLRTNLESALQGLGLEGTNFIVSDGMPANFVTNDMCVIGNVNGGMHQFVVMRAGRKPREEEFFQEVWFHTTRAGSDSTSARTAAYAAMEALENMLADSPGLGLNVAGPNGVAEIPTLRMIVSTFQCHVTQEAALNGWRANLKCEVHVQCRLN